MCGCSCTCVTVLLKNTLCNSARKVPNWLLRWFVASGLYGKDSLEGLENRGILYCQIYMHTVLFCVFLVTLSLSLFFIPVSCFGELLVNIIPCGPVIMTNIHDYGDDDDFRLHFCFTLDILQCRQPIVECRTACQLVLVVLVAAGVCSSTTCPLKLMTRYSGSCLDRSVQSAVWRWCVTSWRRSAKDSDLSRWPTMKRRWSQ